MIIKVKWLSKGTVGMTVWPFIFLDAKRVITPEDINHEKIHLRQQKELLIIGFYLWYFIEYGIRWAVCGDQDKAYRSISFEKEAYANQKDLNYLIKRTLWSFLRYL